MTLVHSTTVNSPDTLPLERPSATPSKMCVLSGAGAGKTGLLCATLIDRLAAGANPERVVAVTFTRASGRELRDRAIRAAGPAVVAEVERVHIGTIDSTLPTLIKTSRELVYGARLAALQQQAAERAMRRLAETELDDILILFDQGRQSGRKKLASSLAADADALRIYHELPDWPLAAGLTPRCRAYAELVRTYQEEFARLKRGQVRPLADQHDILYEVLSVPDPAYEVVARGRSTRPQPFADASVSAPRRGWRAGDAGRRCTADLRFSSRRRAYVLGLAAGAGAHDQPTLGPQHRRARECVARARAPGPNADVQ